jgi:hypothetical protein
MNNLPRNHQLQGLDKKKAQAGRPAPIFLLYIFIIPLREGQMCHLPGLYFPNKTNSLRQKEDAQALDKFLEDSWARAKENRGRREGQTSPT